MHRSFLIIHAERITGTEYLARYPNTSSFLLKIGTCGGEGVKGKDVMLRNAASMGDTVEGGGSVDQLIQRSPGSIVWAPPGKYCRDAIHFEAPTALEDILVGTLHDGSTSFVRFFNVFDVVSD